MILRYACCKHMVDHLFCIHVLRPAVTVPYHHNSRNAQFIYRNKQASNYASKGMRNYAPCIFDYFRIAILQTKCRRKQFGQTRIHTTNNRKLFIRIFIRHVAFIRFLFDKFLIKSKNVINCAHYNQPRFTQYLAITNKKPSNEIINEDFLSLTLTFLLYDETP